MNLQLTYTNRGRSPIILFKYSSVIFEHMIADSLKAALEQRYQSDTSSYAVVYGKGLEITPTPSDLFVVVKPGDSHETNGVLYLVNGSDRPSAVKTGEHYLQVKVRTWIDAPDLVPVLRRQWASYGELWNQPVTSEPMQFFIKDNQQLVKCS